MDTPVMFVVLCEGMSADLRGRGKRSQTMRCLLHLRMAIYARNWQFFLSDGFL